MNNNRGIVPPLKWAGGKRWFAARYRNLLPTKFETYVEPFVGSGALFFSLLPERAVLSDANKDLINLYRVIRDNPGILEGKMRLHQRLHNKDYFYKIRASKPRSAIGHAARMLYLNRTCWNGLYRVNAEGQFNVPIGTKNTVLLETDDFHGLSECLRNVDLLVSDFQEVLDSAGPGDFAFVDPPYTVAHNQNGFIKYNEKLFAWEDQVRLAAAVRDAANRGVQVLMTNAAHASIFDLYEGFERVVVDRSGVIAGTAAHRGKFSELVIKCY